MDKKNRMKDLTKYVTEICSDSITFYEEIDEDSLLVILDEPGRWIESDYGMIFVRSGIVSMLLFKIEDNKFVIKRAYYMQRSKYQTDYRYVIDCKNELLEAVRKQERRKKK